MEIWQRWLDMATDSYLCAELARTNRRNRSAASRYYYCAFEAATALMHYRKLVPPIVDGIGREAWSHLVTPGLFDEHLKPFVKNRRRRLELSDKLRALYQMRVDAHYKTAHSLSENGIVEASKDSNYVLGVVSRLLRS